MRMSEKYVLVKSGLGDMYNEFGLWFNFDAQKGVPGARILMGGIAAWTNPAPGSPRMWASPDVCILPSDAANIVVDYIRGVPELAEVNVEIVGDVEFCPWYETFKSILGTIRVFWGAFPGVPMWSYVYTEEEERVEAHLPNDLAAMEAGEDPVVSGREGFHNIESLWVAYHANKAEKNGNRLVAQWCARSLADGADEEIAGSLLREAHGRGK